VQIGYEHGHGLIPKTNFHLIRISRIFPGVEGQSSKCLIDQDFSGTQWACVNYRLLRPVDCDLVMRILDNIPLGQRIFSTAVAIEQINQLMIYQASGVLDINRVSVCSRPLGSDVHYIIDAIGYSHTSFGITSTHDSQCQNNRSSLAKRQSDTFFQLTGIIHRSGFGRTGQKLHVRWASGRCSK